MTGRSFRAFKAKSAAEENVGKPKIDAAKSACKPKIAAFLALAFLAFALCSCQSLKRAAAPVAIFDARVRECPPDFCGQDSGGQGLGVEFTVVNLCGRPIKSVSFRAAVFQREDGGEGGSDDFSSDVGEIYEACLALQDGLDAGEERTLFIPLEDAPPDCEADDLEIESVLVESAECEVGELLPHGN